MTARVAGGIGLVGCAAIVALSMGGSGLFGGLGSLFGRGSAGPSLQVANEQQRDTDIVAASQAQTVRAGAPVATQRPIHERDEPSRERRTPASRGPRTPEPAPGPGPTDQQPSPPDIPAPPSPGRGQVVAAVSQAADQVIQQAPPQAAPVTRPVQDIVGQIVQTCQGLPVCP